MTSEYGLSSAGFRRKPRHIIISEMKDAAKIAFGSTVNTDDTTPLGMFIGVVAASLDASWQLSEGLYYSAFLATSTGKSLDNVGEYIGVKRRPAVSATGHVTISGSSGVDIPTGFRVATTDGTEFYVSNGGTISGGSVTLPVTATMPGTQGNVGATLVSQIPIPMMGVETVTNATAISGGLRAETDAEFRQRYRRQVAKAGGSTSSSIEAAILNVYGVEEAYVRQNITGIEADGIPPHSIAPLVYGGADDDVAESIFRSKSGGIQSAAVGSDPGQEVEITKYDSKGMPQIVGFARPEEVNIYIDCVINTDTGFPLDGVDKVKNVLSEYINDLRIGETVVYTRLIARIQTVPGITDIPELFVGTTPAPITATNIPVNGDQIARTDISDIGVVEAS